MILPDFTFVATASAVLFANALPVLVDVDPETYCIDPDLVEAAITPRTKAIIAVHMGGHPADLDRLKEIAGARDWHWSKTRPMHTPASGGESDRNLRRRGHLQFSIQQTDDRR